MIIKNAAFLNMTDSTSVYRYNTSYETTASIFTVAVTLLFLRSHAKTTYG